MTTTCCRLKRERCQENKSDFSINEKSDSSSCHLSLFNLQQVVVTLIIKLLLFSEKLLNALIRQTEENSVLLRQALAELKELKMQVQSQRKIPFTVKTCGFEVHHIVSFILFFKQDTHTYF